MQFQVISRVDLRVVLDVIEKIAGTVTVYELHSKSKDSKLNAHVPHCGIYVLQTVTCNYRWNNGYTTAPRKTCAFYSTDEGLLGEVHIDW